MAPEPAVNFLALFDVAVVVVAAPIMLLIGVPALGYALGGGAWVLLRLVGLGVDRAASGMADARAQISIRMGFMLGRLFALAIAVIVARSSGTQGDGLTALAVVVVAFTISMITSALNRPRSR